MDVDTQIFDKLSENEREKLHTQLNKLTDAVSLIESEIGAEDRPSESKTHKIDAKEPKRLFIARRHEDEPYVFCELEDRTIRNLVFSLPFSMKKYLSSQKDELEYIAVFVDDNNEELCPAQTFFLKEGGQTKVSFSLNTSASGLSECFLVLRSCKDALDEAQQLIRFQIKILFNTEFDF